MQILIASDNQALAVQIRQILAHHGHSCPLSRVVPLERLHEESHAAGVALDLVVLALPPGEESAISILEQAREAAAGWLAVIGDTRNPSQILAAIHAGTDDYWDETGDLSRQMGAFLARIGTSPRSTSSHGRMTLVATANGGCGGSLTAVNLAVALQQESGSCVLLDFVPRQGDLAAMLDVKPRHTLADLCRNIDKLDGKMFEHSLSAHESGVQLLAAPLKPSEIEHVTVEAASRVARLAQSCFLDSVIDADAVFQQSGRQLLHWSTRIVLLVRLDFTSLRNAGRLLEHWRQLQVPSEKLMLVANRSGQSHELPASKAEDALQHPIAFAIPDDPKTVNSSINRGCPAVSDSPKTRFAGAFREIARAIAGAAALDPAPTRTPAPAWSRSLLEKLGVGGILSAFPRFDHAAS